MSVLKNPKHERFAQELVKGKNQADAYEQAGYKPHRGNASSLAQDKNILARVSELLERRDTIEHKATEKAIERLAVTKERVLGELAKIAFADIRKAVRWGRSPVDTKSEHASPNGLGMFPVELVPSELIDDDIAAAVSEVSLTQNGVKIKMHDKKGALVDLGRHLGLFIDRHEHGGPGDFDNMTTDELRDSITRDLARLGAEDLSTAISEGARKTSPSRRTH